MPGPHPAVARTRLLVRRSLATLAPAPSRVVVAVSGGADSLALAAATAFEARGSGFAAGAAIVDHGLQTDSAAVAERAADQCRDLGLDPVQVRRVTVDAGNDGPEMAARTARYAALESIRVEQGADLILLAHTRDDQAEQVLLGLLRGSGARSLSGMPPHRGAVLRPLLEATRDDTEAACAALGLTPWHDPHNDDVRFTRVRARHLLRDVSDELGAQVSGNLARTADLLRADDAALSEWAATVAATATQRPDGTLRLAVEVFRPLPRAVRTRVLRHVALAAGADGSALAAVHLEEVDHLVTAWHGQGPIDLPGQRQAVRQGTEVAFGPRRQVQ